MTADDISRDALIERVADVIHRYEAWNVTEDRLAERDWEVLVGAAVVDAVVLPLVQEQEAYRRGVNETRAAYDEVKASRDQLRGQVAEAYRRGQADAADRLKRIADLEPDQATFKALAVDNGIDYADGYFDACIVARDIAEGNH